VVKSLWADIFRCLFVISRRATLQLIFRFPRQGTHAEILEFVESNFGAKEKFTWFEKGHVNGKNTREVYSFLKQKLPSADGSADIRWNFAKFLVDREGTPFKRYGPKTKPDDMVADIEELLAKK